MKRLLLILAILVTPMLRAQVRYGDQQTSSNATLTVTATGTGTGSITSADGGISSCTSVGGICSHSYLIGTLVNLTPTATGGSGFAWSSGTDGAGVCSGAGGCLFTITSTATLTGIFTGSGGGAIPASPTFAIDPNSSTVYPNTINHGQDRFWDTPGTQWSMVETANNTFTWASIDTLLQNAAANSVHTAQYALARTPNFASSNTNLTVAGSLTSGSFTASETLTQAVSGITATFVSQVGAVLTISQYSGTANATGAWTGGTSGAVFTPTALPTGCNYFVNGSANPGQKSGQCAPPTDLNSDGTGTDLYFRNWVAAIVTHVNQAGYLAGTGTWAAGQANCPGAVACSHAHIAYWEVWNEPFTTKFWIGTPDQLARMEQDAYCIIKGGAFTIAKTGETCAAVRATVTSVSLSGAVDATALVVMPSYQPSGTNIMQCFLYSTGGGCTGTSGSAGANQTDAINFHAKPGASLETSIPSQVTAIDAVLQSAELAKPLYNTEAGYSASGWNGAYLDVNMQVSYVCRLYPNYYAGGVTNIVWYNWGPNTSGLGSATANTAYGICYNWLVGAAPGTISHVGNVYTYTLTLPNGVAAALIWDISQNCSGTPSVCTFSTQTVNSGFLTYLDLYGNAAVSIVSHQMPVGIMPRLAQAQ